MSSNVYMRIEFNAEDDLKIISLVQADILENKEKETYTALEVIRLLSRINELIRENSKNVSK